MIVNDPLFQLFTVVAICALFSVLGWVAGRLIAVVIGALNVGQ